MTEYKTIQIDVQAFQLGIDEAPDWINVYVENNTIVINVNENDTNAIINPHERNERGNTVYQGNYIIKGLFGEIYSQDAEYFNATHELA